jgi:adenosylhomocysteine nucleosidase
MAKIAVFVASSAEIKKSALSSLEGLHQVQLFYTGLGKLRAGVSASEILTSKKWDLAVNLGTAGSHKQAVGSVVECAAFVERDVDLTPAGLKPGQFPGAIDKIVQSKKYFPDLPSVICGTGDRIDVEPPPVECEIYDMEAYSLAFVCQRFSVPFLCLKYITDSSSAHIFQEWKGNLLKAETALISVFTQLLKELK